MFPTHVGMNRSLTNALPGLGHVPHTRGDEPVEVIMTQHYQHVPHTRGDEPVKDGIFFNIQKCSPHTWG